MKNPLARESRRIRFPIGLMLCIVQIALRNKEIYQNTFVYYKILLPLHAERA